MPLCHEVLWSQGPLLGRLAVLRVFKQICIRSAVDSGECFSTSGRRQLRSTHANVLSVRGHAATRRQEFLGRESKSLEQSACSAAKAGRRIRTVQATFKVISFWRDLGAFVTFSCYQCAVHKLIYLLTY